jgi:hypothetical protein
MRVPELGIIEAMNFDVVAAFSPLVWVGLANVARLRRLLL